MTRRVAIAILLALPLVLGGCGQVQDAAQESASQAASDAATKAATKVAGAAADQVRTQVCQRVQDGQVSAQDKQVLAGLVGAAEQAGVPPEITTPLRAVADSGDQAPAEAVRELTKACG